MSVAGILASSLFSHVGSQLAQKVSKPGSASVAGQFESELQSGNLAGAQSLFASVQQKVSAQAPGSSTVQSAGSTLGSNGSTLAGEAKQLGSDLQSGNLIGAQTDYSSLKSSFSHLRHTLDGSGDTATSSDPLSAALQAYSSLQQNPLNSSLSSSLLGSASSLSVNA